MRLIANMWVLQNKSSQTWLGARLLEMVVEIFGEALLDVLVSAWWLWTLLIASGVGVFFLYERLERGPEWRQSRRRRWRR